MKNRRSLHNSRFLKACRRQTVDCTPVWFMRQAGRYMAEYRAIRQQHTLLEICRTPELAAEVTLQPIHRFAVDAAIIFADILLPIIPMGCELDFVKGEGPVIGNPVRNQQDVDALSLYDPETELHFVMQAIRIAIRKLGEIPLIGFAGAPFTVASYMIEGGHSRHFLRTRRLMFDHPEAWHSLMHKISEITARYLKAQIDAGADAVQLFDSWVGCLGPSDYAQFVLPYSKKILQSLDVPAIHFSTGTGGYLHLLAEAGGDVLGVDWRISLSDAWKAFPERGIQGNLDPLSLFKPSHLLAADVRSILDEASGRRGHIFNLGHGILPETPVENVERVVQEVHNYRTTIQ